MHNGQKQLTEKEQEFVKRTHGHRKEKVEELAYKALGVSLSANVPVFELPYYILQRGREVMLNAVASVDFTNPELQKARKNFLRECLRNMKKNIVVPPKKEEKDLTDIRDNQCEPIAQEIVNMVLDEDLIFSDEAYFDEVLANEESVPLSACINGYADALEEKLLMIISEHWRRANTQLWGVEKEDVTFEMLDAVLKKQ